MDYFWGLATWILLLCTFFTTVRLSLEGILSFSNHNVVKFISHKYWCFSLIIFIPPCLGGFGHGETSPLPWKAFFEPFMRGGGLLSMLTVCMVDLWLLWTPAQIYVNKLPESQKEKAKFIRIINVLAGLLLMTPGSPVHQLLEWLAN